jgi:hypothetical protein
VPAVTEFPATLTGSMSGPVRTAALFALLLTAACKGDGGAPADPPAQAHDAALVSDAVEPTLTGVWIGDAARAQEMALVLETGDPEEREAMLERLQAELPTFEVEFTADTMTQRFEGEVVKQGRYQVTAREGQRWTVALATDAGADEGLFVLDGPRLTLVGPEGAVGMVLLRKE